MVRKGGTVRRLRLLDQPKGVLATVAEKSQVEHRTQIALSDVSCHPMCKLRHP
jgi:hypothetical protein